MTSFDVNVSVIYVYVKEILTNYDELENVNVISNDFFLLVHEIESEIDFESDYESAYLGLVKC